MQRNADPQWMSREEDTYLLLSLNNVKLPCLVIQRSK